MYGYVEMCIRDRCIGIGSFSVIVIKVNIGFQDSLITTELGAS